MLSLTSGFLRSRSADLAREADDYGASASASTTTSPLPTPPIDPTERSPVGSGGGGIGGVAAAPHPSGGEGHHPDDAYCLHGCGRRHHPDPPPLLSILSSPAVVFGGGGDGSGGGWDCPIEPSPASASGDDAGRARDGDDGYDDQGIGEVPSGSIGGGEENVVVGSGGEGAEEVDGSPYVDDDDDDAFPNVSLLGALSKLRRRLSSSDVCESGVAGTETDMYEGPMVGGKKHGNGAFCIMADGSKFLGRCVLIGRPRGGRARALLRPAEFGPGSSSCCCCC